MKPLIRATDLYFSYQDNAGNSRPALVGVDLEIHEGESIAIIGANGSGKSTLARHLNGLLFPTQGEVFVDGVRTQENGKENELRRNIAMVFQHPESQVVATTVEEDVAFGPENLGIPTEEIRHRVDWALDVVGLAGLQKRAPHHLSGGQQQRLALAGALAMQPRCIVFDEATSMLDPAGRKDFRSIVKKLHEAGVTTVMITQEMDEAVFSDRVIVLSQGRIVRDGATRLVMADDEFLQSVGLEAAPMTRLAQKLHANLPDFPGDLLTPEEVIEQLRSRFPIRSDRWSNTEERNVSTGDPVNTIDLRASSAHEDPFIEAQGLWHTYLRGTPLETEALRGVDFQMADGEIVGVIGATGSGKSTLLQHFNGLLSPQRGLVRVGDETLSGSSLNLRRLRQQVALLFQQPEDQLFERYVADDIAFGPLNLGLARDEVRRRVSEAMQSVGLMVDEFRDRTIYSLSGGERRRAALAGVLALEPKVLVLDEATAGLDPRGRRDLIGFLRSWQANGDRSIVWASHAMDEIAQIASRITALADGRVVIDGSPTQVFQTNGALTSYGLDVPQIARVLSTISRPDLPVDESIFTIDGAVEYLRRIAA